MGEALSTLLSVRCWWGLALEAGWTVVDWKPGWELRGQTLRREPEELTIERCWLKMSR